MFFQSTNRLQPDTNPEFFHHLSAELFVLSKIVDYVSTTIINASDERAKLDTILLSTLKNLRNCCALGEAAQNAIASVQQFSNDNQTEDVHTWKSISTIVQTEAPQHENGTGLQSISAATRKMCWQFVANLSVQNSLTQQRVWDKFHDLFLSYMASATAANARECTMIVYNVYLGGAADANAKEIFALLANNVNAPLSHDNDFFHIFMEHFITASRSVVALYAACDCSQRLTVLYYIADYMRGGDHRQTVIHTALLQHICREFKKKSDCVLKTVSSYVDRIEPKEVVAMLEVITQASSDERYTHVLSEDGSLFLNVGCLLQSAHRVGQQSDGAAGNIFTPVQKLGQIAPNSMEDTAIERDISYELKSMLVRTIGNLAYKNRKNQDLVSAADGNQFISRDNILIIFLCFDLFTGERDGHNHGRVRFNEC